MLALLSVLAIITVSLVITRMATVVLATTGLSRDVARFQARSAFTGSGFTTTESESVVTHPVRRRVVMALMLLGNAGIVTTITSLLLSFNQASGGQTAGRIGLLVGGLVALRLLAGSHAVDRLLTRLTEWALRRYTDLELHDYATLLHVSDRYTIVEAEPGPDEWLSGRLDELRLRDEGVIVLGVQRKGGDYLGVPTGETVVHPGDVLVLYGEAQAVRAASIRRAGPEGDAEHARAAEAYRSGTPIAGDRLEATPPRGDRP